MNFEFNHINFLKNNLYLKIIIKIKNYESIIHHKFNINYNLYLIFSKL